MGSREHLVMTDLPTHLPLTFGVSVVDSYKVTIDSVQLVAPALQELAGERATEVLVVDSYRVTIELSCGYELPNGLFDSS